MEGNKMLENQNSEGEKAVKPRKPRVKVADLRAEIEELKKKNEELEERLKGKTCSCDSECHCNDSEDDSCDCGDDCECKDCDCNDGGCNCGDDCNCGESCDCEDCNCEEECHCNDCECNDECCCDKHKEDVKKSLDIIKILLSVLVGIAIYAVMIVSVHVIMNMPSSSMDYDTSTGAVLVLTDEEDIYLTEGCKDDACYYNQDGYLIMVKAKEYVEVSDMTLQYENYGMLSSGE